MDTICDIAAGTALRKSGPFAVEWSKAVASVPYPEAVAAMEERVAAIQAGTAPELVWLV